MFECDFEKLNVCIVGSCWKRREVCFGGKATMSTSEWKGMPFEVDRMLNGCFLDYHCLHCKEVHLN